MSQVWRVILDGPVDGDLNMALDRAVQLAHAAGDSPPTLRLYRWSRPTVTLGRFQSPDTVDRDACKALGVDIVRRFTGGRGVLHDDELTYSFVAGIADGVPRGVAASYRHLSAALVAAYRSLGVDARLTARPRGDAASASCYLHASHADLSLGIAKLSGSAQVWHKETVLQHGSFTRTRDMGREAEVFRLSPEASRSLAEGTATFADIGEELPSDAEITDALLAAMQQTWGLNCETGQPTPAEKSLAEELLPQVRIP